MKQERRDLMDLVLLAIVLFLMWAVPLGMFFWSLEAR